MFDPPEFPPMGAGGLAPGLRDLWFAMVGSLSVAYESRALFLKHRLEQAEESERDDRLLDTLIASHRLSMDLFWRLFGRRGLDGEFVRRYMRVNAETVLQLAAEGRAAIRNLADARRDAAWRDP